MRVTAKVSITKVYSIVAALLFIYPLFELFLVSISNTLTFPPQNISFEYLNYLRPQFSPYFTSLAFSLKLAALATVLALAVSIPMSYAMTHFRFRGKSIVSTIPIIVITMPSISYLTAVLVWYLVYLGLTNTLLGLALPVALVWIPFSARAIQSSLETVDPALEEVALCCGANPLTTFLRISLPLAAPGVLAGGLLVFAASMNSFLEPLMLGGSQTVTVAQEVYQDLGRGSLVPFVASEAFLMQALTLVLLLVVTLIGRRFFKGIVY